MVFAIEEVQVEEEEECFVRRDQKILKQDPLTKVLQHLGVQLIVEDGEAVGGDFARVSRKCEGKLNCYEIV